MSNDPITIDQLAGEAAGSGAAGAAADAATEADGDTAEWVLDLYDRLKDDGMLQAMLWGPDALPEEAAPEAASEGGAGDVDVDVDAEVVADALEDVKNTVGDLKISQLVKLTRDNPDLVDDLLEEKLAGAGGGADHAGDVDAGGLEEQE